MPKIRAILFDMDGVLVNAQEWHFEALNQALVFCSHTPISHADHLARYDGLPTRTKLALLAEVQPIPASQFEAINALKQKITVEISKEKCVPALLQIETIRKLKEDGYKMTVCSNSLRASVDLLLEKTMLLPFFKFTLSSDDIKHPKPHPEIYITAMERLQVLPSETLILEDNINGIQAARASGAHLLEIRDTHEVNYENIIRRIANIESH